MVLTLTAYLDESGTHGGSAVTVMGGMLANARQWEQFEANFSLLKKKHGFRVFHTKKFKRRDGDFKGWSVDQQWALMKDLGHLTASAFTEGVTMTLNNADYQASYKGGEAPRKLRIESKYGLCFRNCLIFFALEGLKRVHRGKPPRLHFVLESGHANWNEVRDIFNEMKRELQARDCDMLGEITFADKDECDPLMMADFLAHSTYLVGVAPPEERKLIIKERVSLPMSKGESGVTNLVFKPGGLTELKAHLIEGLKAKAWKRPSS